MCINEPKYRSSLTPATARMITIVSRQARRHIQDTDPAFEVEHPYSTNILKNAKFITAWAIHTPFQLVHILSLCKTKQDSALKRKAKEALRIVTKTVESVRSGISCYLLCVFNFSTKTGNFLI